MNLEMTINFEIINLKKSALIILARFFHSLSFSLPDIYD